MVRYIVVTGGVISGVGKGVTTASIGKILQEYNYTVTAIKIDPYLNYDAGTLRPTEHGEVWVTDDGGEIDQDLGNYERFLDVDIPKRNNITSGQVYKTVIDKERRGDFLGETVQFIPHIPDEIKRRIKDASKGHDFALVEIGGTIGDYENLPFLFAMKGIEREIGKENVVYVLVSYLPIPSHMGEMKTKPTQQAIRMLQESGIFPDFIVCRSEKPLDDVRKKKIETYANIPSEYVISEPDIDTIYQIPLDLEKQNLGFKILSEFRMKLIRKPSWREWEKLVERIISPKNRIKVAMVGKYVDIGNFSLKDSYISVNESLIHAGAALDTGVEICWIDSKKIEKEGAAKEVLKCYDGLIIPGGFGATGVEGKINAIKYARENSMPFLGLCYGMQLAVVEFARNVCGMKGANTTEVDPNTPYPVIDLLNEQKTICDKGGTMRLGAYECEIKKDTLAYRLYGKKTISERHRHRYEVNPAYVKILEKNGLVFSGVYKEKNLMEIAEIPDHPYFISSQFHPEFKSRLENPAPLFVGLVTAAIKAKSKS